jgi:hypothetical protein
MQFAGMNRAGCLQCGGTKCITYSCVYPQSCRTRSLSCKTVQQTREKLTSIKQGTLLTEVRSMDEERRSLAELHILKGRIRK